jgi:hypothetical protein
MFFSSLTALIIAKSPHSLLVVSPAVHFCGAPRAIGAVHVRAERIVNRLLIKQIILKILNCSGA